MSTTFYIQDGDIYLEEDSGKPYMIDGVDKCRQDMAQIYLTEYDNARNYGNELSDVASTPLATTGSVASMIRMKISEATDRLIAYQEIDPYVTTDEAISYIKEIKVFTLGNQTYLFYVRAYVKGSDELSEVVLPISMKHLTQFNIEEVFDLSNLLGA